MMIVPTLKTARELIQKHSRFAPEVAEYIALHEDGRVFFATSMEQGVRIWDADTMREKTMQGIIHSLTAFAKRKSQGVNDWEIIKTNLTEEKRGARMLRHQKALAAVREHPITVDPTKTQVIKADPVVEPLFTPSEPETESASEFVSVRTLESSVRRRKEGDLFVSVRTNGKIVIGKALRDHINGWKGLSFMVSKDFRRLALTMGDDYDNNKSGTYLARGLTARLKFPEDSGTIRIIMKWEPGLNSFVGDIR